MHPFDDAVTRVGTIDTASEDAARALHDRLTKPRGALGFVEDIGVRLSGIAGVVPPPVPVPAAIAVFAADHGVVRQGVTPWPQEVTAQMVANFVAGGAAINVLARQMGATVTVVDVGVASELEDAPALLKRKVRAGSRDLATGPALRAEEVERALDVGAEVAALLVGDGARVLVTGEMGIGNTTATAAVIAMLTGRPAADVTGRGTGIDDEMLRRKIAVIARALERAGGLAGGDSPLGSRTVLAEVGGLEIAALCGFVVGAAAARVPVIVDGVVAGAGLLAAVDLCPQVIDFAFAGHRSTEPGAGAVLEHTGLRPILDLDLRLGEGSGACLALPVLEAAARVLGEMATFDSAGVTDKTVARPRVRP